MKRICIDARFWGIKNTGIGRYIENLIDNFPKDPNMEVVLVVNPELKNEKKLYKFRKYYARYHPYSLLSQFEMFFLLTKIKPDLLHIPHFTVPLFWNKPIIITIHDLIKHYSRGSSTTTRNPFIYFVKFYVYLFIVWWGVKRAVHIIVPADYWKQKLLENYNIENGKISVIYEGVSKQFLEDKIFSKEPQKNLVQKPYIIYIGNLYPHKNVETLLKAMKSLSREINLVLVGARSVFLDRFKKIVQKTGLDKRVYFFTNESDRNLVILLKNSLAFVTPSLIEGFGLPGIEAMAVGTPVVAAKSSCLPEIYGDAALYFDPLNEKDLVKQVDKLKKNDLLRQEYIKRGKIQVQQYSWERMSRETWEIYQKELQ